MQSLLQWEGNLGVDVALRTQHAMRMHHTAICGLTHSTSFFHIIS